MHPPRSVYVHVPFCRHRCGYCNFTLIAGRDDLIESYLKAIQIEIDQVPSTQIETLFLGGGTPTHLSIKQLDSLFTTIENRFEFAEGIEISLEGNPLDFQAELVSFLAARGVNRISLGVQSFNQGKLEFLERDHRVAEIQRAVSVIQDSIENFSIDLIIGTKDETAESWLADLQQAIACEPSHVSTYSLTVEKGTQFWNRQNQNQTMQVPEERAVELYEMAVDTLTGAGYGHYEISNFSRPGLECRHNVNYWNGEEYFGFGPGAARYVNGRRAINHQSIKSYLKKVLKGEEPTAESEAIDAEQSAREKLIFGLRQIKGIQLPEFESNTGFTVGQLAGNSLDGLLEHGLLKLEGGQLQLTRKGLLVSDSIWPLFL